MNRRSFVSSLAALVVTPRLLLSLKPAVNPDRLPVLWCDGINDDAPAVQAFCDGFPIWDRIDAREVGLHITGRTLFLHSTVYVGYDDRPRGPRRELEKAIRSCYMISRPRPVIDPAHAYAFRVGDLLAMRA